MAVEDSKKRPAQRRYIPLALFLVYGMLALLLAFVAGLSTFPGGRLFLAHIGHSGPYATTPAPTATALAEPTRTLGVGGPPAPPTATVHGGGGGGGFHATPTVNAEPTVIPTATVGTEPTEIAVPTATSTAGFPLDKPSSATPDNPFGLPLWVFQGLFGITAISGLASMVRWVVGAVGFIGRVFGRK